MLKYEGRLSTWIDSLYKDVSIDPSVEDIFVDAVRAAADHVLFADGNNSPVEVFESAFNFTETLTDGDDYKGDVFWFEWADDIYYFACPLPVAKARIKQEIWDRADVSSHSVKLILKKK
jgi:hypothetical protein